MLVGAGDGVLSSNQALTATAASTNIRNFGNIRNISDGTPMSVMFTVKVAADFTTGDETYAFAIQTDDASGFGSALTLVSRTIAASVLTAGYVFSLPIPTGETEQYLRVNYTLGGTTPSITIDANIVPTDSIPTPRTVGYASGYVA